MKYVALSDLHLGQTGKDKTGEFSLLSSGAESSRAYAKIGSLADTISDFAAGSPTSMIFVGDTLDLSLSHMDTTLRDLVAFFTLNFKDIEIHFARKKHGNS